MTEIAYNKSFYLNIKQRYSYFLILFYLMRLKENTHSMELLENGEKNDWQILSTRSSFRFSKLTDANLSKRVMISWEL